MEVNRLRADELAYELHVRGASVQGTVDQLRSRLRQRLALEKRGSFSQSFCMDLDVNEEIVTCERKLMELSLDILSFNKDNAKNEHSRIMSRILHVSGRLNRLQDETGQAKKEELIERCEGLCEDLDALLAAVEKQAAPQDEVVSNEQSAPVVDAEDLPDDLIELSDVEEPSPTHRNTTRTHGDTPGSNTPYLRPNETTFQDHSNVNRRRVSFQGHPSTSTAPHHSSGYSNLNLHAETFVRNARFSGSMGANPRTTTSLMNNAETSSVADFEDRIRRLNLNDTISFVGNNPERGGIYRTSEDSTAKNFSTVSRWNLIFNGHNMSVTNFLERVEELRSACNIPGKERLIKFAPILLAGTPLHWYFLLRRRYLE